MVGRTCIKCREILKSREPDCKNCKPDLLPQNQTALRIWNLVSDQRIYAGADGVSVALVHSALWRIIDEIGVKNKIKMFERILLVFNSVVNFEIEHRKKHSK